MTKTTQPHIPYLWALPISLGLPQPKSFYVVKFTYQVAVDIVNISSTYHLCFYDFALLCTLVYFVLCTKTCFIRYKCSVSTYYIFTIYIPTYYYLPTYIHYTYKSISLPQLSRKLVFFIVSSVRAWQPCEMIWRDRSFHSKYHE